MRLSDAIILGFQPVKSSNIGNSYIENVVLLAYLLGKDKSYIYSHLSMELPSPVSTKFSSIIKKRAQHYPLAYIIGQKEFMSLDFIVNKNVMIPRPETEFLVEETLKLFLKNNNRPILIVDIGTGCGNIALSLAKYNSNINVYATDISSKSIDVAYKNRKRMNLENSVSFLNCNLWDHFKDKKWKGKIDALVSNPPYIRSGQLNDLAPELSYEPKKALDGGPDGLYFYPLLVEGGEFLLKEGGYIIMEVGYDQAGAVKNILQNTENFEDIIIKKDYSGIDRIIIARRK